MIKHCISIKVANILKIMTLIALALSTSHCSDEESGVTAEVFVDHLEMEAKVLANWMKNYAPDAELQSAGYYIENIQNPPTTSITTPCWIRYNITSQNTVYEVCNTRSEDVAYNQGTFNFYTHYVPTLQYIDSSNYDDALSLAVINGLVGEGSSFRLYMPSSLRGDTPNGTAGYAGQNALLEGRPLISDITITEVIEAGTFNNYQKDIVRGFKDNNVTSGEWIQGGDDTSSDDCIFYTEDYLPSNGALTFDYTTEDGRTNSTYSALVSDANYTSLVDMAARESEIATALASKYINATEDVAIGDNYAYVWYVARLLDGFVIDSNIPEVRDIMRWSSESTNVTPIIYHSNTWDNYISAWSYTIPNLNFEKWTLMVTSSVDAYSYYGRTGSSTSTEIQPYTPIVFQIFVATEYNYSPSNE